MVQDTLIECLEYPKNAYVNSNRLKLIAFWANF